MRQPRVSSRPTRATLAEASLQVDGLRAGRLRASIRVHVPEGSAPEIRVDPRLTRRGRR